MHHPVGPEPGLAFVRVIAPGRELSLTRVRPESFVLRDGDRELGPVNADLHPFLIDLDGEQIVFAGPQHAFTVIVGPEDEHPYPVKNGAWVSHPRPFEGGMQVTGIWQDKDGRELFRLESPPLDRERLDPLFGPGWTGYAPLPS
jgi:hypothetical protein